MDHGPPASEDALRGVYEKLQARQSPDGSEQWLNWAVFDAQEQALGFVQATVLADQRAWVAYVLGRAHWGQGHARAATGAMVAHLEQALGVRLSMACVERANMRSLSLLQHLGFDVASAELAAQHSLTATEVMLARTKSPKHFVWVDSELAGVMATTQGVELRLAAARMAGPGEHYLPGVQLRLQGRVQAGNPQDALGRIVGASLMMGGNAQLQVPVPGQLEGALLLRLQLGNGAELLLEGTVLEVQAPGGARIVERLSC